MREKNEIKRMVNMYQTFQKTAKYTPSLSSYPLFIAQELCQR